MRMGLFALAAVTLLASCGTDIRARCSAQHSSDTAATDRCVTQAENAIRNRHKRTGGPNG